MSGGNKTQDTGIIKRIQAKTSRFEYIGGWESGKNAMLYIECKDCGYIFKHSSIFTKPSRTQQVGCPNCKKILSQIKQERISQEKEKRKLEALANKKQHTQFTNPKQIKMVVCKQCNTLFATTNSKRKY